MPLKNSKIIQIIHFMKLQPFLGSKALYCEIAPQTDTRPNVFISGSTVSKKSPPTYYKDTYSH